MSDSSAGQPEIVSASVSQWIQGLKDGERDSAQQLWNRYFQKLISQVEKRTHQYNCPNGVIVAEDVAASVFESICKGAQAGRFQDVTNRDELWWLLLAITRRKLVDHIRRETAVRRFPGRSPISLNDSGSSGEFYRELVSEEPTVEYVAIFKEQYDGLLSALRDDKLRQIAVLKIEGYSNEEIQAAVGISSATMSRKIKLIRDTWHYALTNQGSDDGNQ
jgi:DNA-directed RNA polymerase specialized sigma24 family protein